MRRRLIASLLVLGVVAAACSDDDVGDEGQTTPTTGDEVTEDTEPVDGATATTEVGDDVPETTEPGHDVTDTTEPGGLPADADPDAVARFAYDLVATQRGGFTWNPAESGASTGDLGMYHLVYGGLMRPLPDGTRVPDLAEEVTIADENTIEIVLREGLTLPDGSAFDAELVEATLQSNLELEGVPAFGSDFFKLSEIEVTSPTSLELTIPDGTAAGWADTFLSGMETVIMPPDTDFNRPAGAGPFTVVEYVAEERAVLERNPDYWDVESINVGRIELVNAQELQTGVSALNAGQVDWAALDVATMDAVGSQFETSSIPDANFIANLVICKSTEPFDDPRIRQALSMGIDRDVINDALFAGAAEPAWDLWPEGHPFHNPDLTERYAYDPEGARALLAEAGYPDGFEFDGLPIPMGGSPEMAQVVQQQFAEIGVTMNISQSANFVEDLFLNNSVPVGIVPSMGEGGTGKLRQWAGDSIGNICGYEDPELDDLVAQLLSVSSDSDEAVDLWHEIQEIVVEDVLSILVAFQPQVYAYDPDVLGGVELSFYTVRLPEMRELYVF